MPHDNKIAPVGQVQSQRRKARRVRWYVVSYLCLNALVLVLWAYYGGWGITIGGLLGLLWLLVVAPTRRRSNSAIE